MRFFSPPENPAFTERLSIDVVHVDELAASPPSIEELQRIDLFLAARLADLVVRGAQEVRVRDARDLDRILEREEDARLRALLGLEREQVAPLVQ